MKGCPTNFALYKVVHNIPNVLLYLRKDTYKNDNTGGKGNGTQ